MTKCILGLHKWIENRSKFGLVRGCLRCGKMQTRFECYWHDMAEDWTMQKWLDMQQKEDEQRLKEATDKLYLRKLELAHSPEDVAEALIYLKKRFESTDEVIGVHG